MTERTRPSLAFPTLSPPCNRFAASIVIPLCHFVNRSSRSDRKQSKSWYRGIAQNRQAQGDIFMSCIWPKKARQAIVLKLVNNKPVRSTSDSGSLRVSSPDREQSRPFETRALASRINSDGGGWIVVVHFVPMVRWWECILYDWSSGGKRMEPTMGSKVQHLKPR